MHVLMGHGDNYNYMLTADATNVACAVGVTDTVILADPSWFCSFKEKRNPDIMYFYITRVPVFYHGLYEKVYTFVRALFVYIALILCMDIYWHVASLVEVVTRIESLKALYSLLYISFITWSELSYG